eukprot:CAMPEP_0167750606 /NCGR_PEP_ID=MMETSP0110_2-20121227/6089_1 /TAXON_ID=629695 /ORGANISM="Gymnochlora sp., Strain CCMP2014" /LENGTH=547 /DNA_ID=CAMNT_0007635955 /DNA_START=50 /DNA_END=1693 /DNA_ORIENTATION=-
MITVNSAPSPMSATLLRDILKLQEGPATRDEDPEDVGYGGEAAKTVQVDDGLYEGTDAFTRRSKLRSLGDMGKAYRGKVVSRSTLDEASSKSKPNEALDDDMFQIDFEEKNDEVEEEDVEDEEGSLEEDNNDDGFENSQSRVRFANENIILGSQVDGEGAGRDNEDYNGNAETNLAAAAGISEQLGKTIAKEIGRVENDEKAFTIERTKHRQNKAQAVRLQHRLWETSLKVRIRMQALNKIANKLPYPREHKLFCESQSDVSDGFDNAAKATYGILQSLIQAKQTLCKASTIFSNSPASVGPKKRKYSDMATKKLWKNVSDGFQEETRLFGETLERWNIKTKLVSGQSKKRFKAIDRGVTEQIDDLLRDMPSLVRRTQLRRSGDRALGCARIEGKGNSVVNGKEVSYDEEIFDDTDFYQELLKEVIDGASLDSMNGAVSLQRRLPKSVKKLKDRRASKGRKIRFVNIPKLTNFTSPGMDNAEDYPRDNLFRSLFGRSDMAENVGSGSLGEHNDKPEDVEKVSVVEVNDKQASQEEIHPGDIDVAIFS